MKKERTPLTNSNFGLMGWTLVAFYFFALFMDVGISADGAQIVIPAISEATGWNPSRFRQRYAAPGGRPC